MPERFAAGVRRRLARLRDRRDSGFTILEVMVAFTLFVSVCATATIALVNSLNAAHGSQQRIDAANVAQTIIAQTQAQAQLAANGTTSFSATVKQSENFTVRRTIAFLTSGATKCTPGSTFSVNVMVYQTETNKYLARSDSVIAC